MKFFKHSVWFYLACILGGFLALVFNAGAVYWAIGIVMLLVGLSEITIAACVALKGTT